MLNADYGCEDGAKDSWPLLLADRRFLVEAQARTYSIVKRV
jgi:hypothetical protein